MDSPTSPSSQHSQQTPFDPIARSADLLDFADFALDTDHRKRRRNRTTQSCLNCHTSKRKCDRKRPCSRCIQLGLTGLCVYEVDDPALRDDPNIDENTRLRNRIAELESLVRELRGKPHPRWADNAFADGDPQDKWHSRANKRPHVSLQVRRHRDHLALGTVPDFASSAGHLAGHQHSPSVKSEPTPDLAATFPYRFSPSPDSHTSSPYTPYPPSSNIQGYSEAQAQAAQQQQAAYRDGRDASYYGQYSPHAAHVQPASRLREFCGCSGNVAAAHPMILLSHQLRTALQTLMALPEHAHGGAAACALMRRVKELNDLLHGSTDAPSFAHQQQHPQQHHAAHASTPSHHVPVQHVQHAHASHGYAHAPQHHAPHHGMYAPGAYDTLSTPPDSEVMTPLSSAESAPVPAAQLHEWAALTHAQGSSYNPYFPPLPPAAGDKPLAGGAHEEYAPAAQMVQ